MTRNIIFPAIAIIALLFSSCEKEIVFKGEVKKPVLVLNGFLNPDSVVAIHLSKSRFVMDDKTPFAAIENATVDVWVNGSRIETLRYTGRGYYRGVYRPKINDRIAIHASASGFEPIKAETVIPSAPAFELKDSTLVFSEIDLTGIYPSNAGETYKALQQKNNIRLALKDNAKEENYYFIQAVHNLYTEDNQTWRYPQKIELDKVLQDNALDDGSLISKLLGEADSNSKKAGNIFTDMFVNGKEVLFKFDYTEQIRVKRFVDDKEVPHPLKRIEKEYVISLSAMSEAYYQFVISSLKAYTMEESPFIEPIQVKTNVENGLGILGSYVSRSFAYRFYVYN